MVKKLNALVLLLVSVAFAVSAEDDFDDLEWDSISVVQDTVVASMPEELIFKAQLQDAQYLIDSLQERLIRLEEDYAIIRGNEVSLQCQNRSFQVQIDSLRRANNVMSGQLSSADSIKAYYAKNLFRYVTTPHQIRTGVDAIKSIRDSRTREANERFLPGLEQMDNLNHEVLRVLKSIRDDGRRTNMVYFYDWREDADNKLNILKTRLNVSNYFIYERLDKIVTEALEQVNTAEDEREAPDFADLIEEFRYIGL